MVEHSLGKGEVESSILSRSTILFFSFSTNINHLHRILHQRKYHTQHSLPSEKNSFLFITASLILNIKAAKPTPQYVSYLTSPTPSLSLSLALTILPHSLPKPPVSPTHLPQFLMHRLFMPPFPIPTKTDSLQKTKA